MKVFRKFFVALALAEKTGISKSLIYRLRDGVASKEDADKVKEAIKEVADKACAELDNINNIDENE